MLVVFLFPCHCFCLSVSLMEHLPTHTFPHSCPLLTHLSIHSCLSAYVSVFVWVLVFIGKAKTVAHVSTPVRPRCSPPLCVCVSEEHPTRRSKQMRRKIFLQHLLRRASSWDGRCAIVCDFVYLCTCTCVRGSYLTMCWWVMAGVSLCPGCRLLLFVMCSNSLYLPLLTSPKQAHAHTDTYAYIHYTETAACTHIHTCAHTNKHTRTHKNA